MDESRNLFDEMEELMDITLTHKAFQKVTSGYWKPPMNIYETPDEVVVYVEVAGMKKSGISITYRDGCLHISGFRKDRSPERVITLHRMEMDNGRFLRKIKINIPIIVEGIEAEYRNGILRITLPKRNKND